MKIYLYSPETGLYLGEDFADKCLFRDAPRELPPGCTTVAPPECEKGEVPVYDVISKGWRLSTLSGEAAKAGIVLGSMQQQTESAQRDGAASLARE